MSLRSRFKLGSSSRETPQQYAILRPRAPNIFPGSYAVAPQLQGASQFEAGAYGVETGTVPLGRTDSTAGEKASEKRRFKLADPVPMHSVLIAPSESWRDALRETVDLSAWTDLNLWKAGLVELCSSMALAFITGAIGVTVSGYPPYMIGPVIFFATAAVLSLFIYAFSTASGAHINPLISIATMLAGLSHPVRSIIYVICQVAGACIGGAFLRVGLGYARASEVHNGGCFLDPNGPVTAGQAAAIEFMASLVMLMLSFGVGLDPRQKELYGATLGPLLVGLSVGLIAAGTSALNPGYTGAGMNPGRCFGLAAGLGKFYSHDWVWWLPDIAAAALHAVLYSAVPPYTREVKCPEPKGNSQTGPAVGDGAV